MAHRESGVRDFAQEQQAVPHDVRAEMGDAEYEAFLAEARQMILTREQKARIASVETELKTNLMKTLERFGEPYGDQGQHQTIEFPRPIRGITRFTRQTKVTIGVDETAAEAIAKDRGIYDDLFKPVMTLDDAAVMVALERGLLTEADIAAIFPQKTIHAFTVEKK